MKKIMFAALCLTPFFVSAQPLNFNAMAKKCAKDIDPMTFQAIARTESSFNPYAIGVVNGVLRRQPENKAEALAAVQQLRQQGRNFSMGIVQVNVKNMRPYGLTDDTIFDVCENLRVGGAILKDCFSRASGDEQQRLQQALSCYYSGNFRRGFASHDNYVARVVNNAKLNTPNQTIRPPKIAAKPVMIKTSTTIPAIDTTRPVKAVGIVKTPVKKAKKTNPPFRQPETFPKQGGISNAGESKQKKQSWDIFGEF